METGHYEELLKTVEQLMKDLLMTYPSYFISRREEIEDASDDEKSQIINEIYLEFVHSEGGSLFEFVDRVLERDDYDGRIKDSLNDFAEDVIMLDLDNDEYQDLDEKYAEVFSKLVYNVFDSRKRNNTLDIIKHFRKDRELIERCDGVISRAIEFLD